MSHELAEEHAHAQYEEYDRQRRLLADASDTDFDQAVRQITDAEPEKAEELRRAGKKREGDEPGGNA